MGRSQISSFVLGGGLLFSLSPIASVQGQALRDDGTERAQISITSAELLDTWEDLEQYLVLLCMVLDCDLNRPATGAATAASIDAAALQIAQTYETRGVRPNLTFNEKVIGHLTVSRILRILAANPDRMSRLIRDRLAADLVCLRAELEQ